MEKVIEIIKCLIVFISILSSCNYIKDERSILGKTHAQKELEITLNPSIESHNYIDNQNIIIKDSITAIQVAEPILFDIYGKDNIIKQRPYETYHLDHYWVINGTRSYNPNQKGGTFIIIIDSRNSQIIKISHGK